MPRIIATLLLLALLVVQPATAATATGKIKVVDVAGQNTIGFLQLTGAQDRYIVGSSSSADNFSFDTADSSPLSITDTDAAASHPILAGLISPGVELLASNSNAAIIGDAPVTTASGSTPQSGGSTSIPGAEYETAIWSVDNTTQAISGRWVNHDGSLPATTVVWDPVGQVIYLTANPSAVILNHPGSQTVSLSFVGSIPRLTPTSTALSSNLNPSFTTSPNNSVILTAAVTSTGSPVTTGSVTFQDGGSTISGCSAINVNATTGQAQCTAAFTAEGSHQLAAVYSGTGTFATSTGNLTQSVDNHTTSPSSGTYCNTGSLSVGVLVASVYPSHLYVPATPGAISSLSLQFSGVTTSDMSSVAAMLVSPDGAYFVPLNKVGQAQSEANVGFTLQDGATQAPANGGLANSATYGPAAYTPQVSFPSPAPPTANGELCGPARIGDI